MMKIGEREDFERLLLEYGNKIFNTIYRMLGDYHESEDVFQEVFFLAYANRHRFRGDSQPGTWIYSITMNAVKAHIRRNRRRLRLVSESDVEKQEAALLNGMEESLEEQYLSRETNHKIQKSLMKLPLEFREVFVLNCIEGYSYREIAGIIGVPIGTVESRLFRARDHLRRDLSDLEGKE